MLTASPAGASSSAISTASFDESKWYHNEIVYSPESQQMQWTITDIDSGSVFYSTNIGLAGPLGTFDQVWVGYESVPPVYGSGAEIYVDNVGLELTPEPSTFALLGIGAISLFAYTWRKWRAA